MTIVNCAIADWWCNV